MKVEWIEDLPIILSNLRSVGFSETFDKHFRQHGNWSGLSMGQVTEVWLCHILSEGTHQLSHVEGWALGREHVLRGLTRNKRLSSQDFNDDRLGCILDHMGEDDSWEKFECSLNRDLIRVHALPSKEGTVRLDATIAQSFRPVGGVFQYGYSKQRRADLPQIKLMLSTLDPLGMPLTVQVVAGNKADDELYLPALAAARRNVGLSGFMYVGDCKMGSIEVRHDISSHQDYYLMPLSLVQCPEKQIREYLALPEAKQVTLIEEQRASGEKRAKATVFEVGTAVALCHNGLAWEERRVVAYSHAHAKSQIESFDKRLEAAGKEINDLAQPKRGRKPLSSCEEFAAAAQTIMEKHRVEGFFEVRIKQTQNQSTQRKYRDRPEQTITQTTFAVQAEAQKQAIEEHKKVLGWRVYATNAPKEGLDPKQALELYWQEYQIEQRFHELQNKVTALLPIFLQKPQRVIALVRLMIVALKFSTLIQHQVRELLKQNKQTINELYPGNPGRKTAMPTTALILSAFQGIALVIHSDNTGNNNYVIANIEPKHNRLLALLGLDLTDFNGIAQFLKSG